MAKSDGYTDLFWSYFFLQIKHYTCAAGLALLDFDTAALGLDNPLAQVQTQTITGTMASCGIKFYKGFEYLFDLFCRYTRSVVINDDLNSLCSLKQADFDRLAVGE